MVVGWSNLGNNAYSRERLTAENRRRCLRAGEEEEGWWWGLASVRKGEGERGPSVSEGAGDFTGAKRFIAGREGLG